MKQIAVVGVCLVAFLMNALPAQACSCIPPPSPAEALTEAAAVFAGEVLNIEDKDDGRSVGERIVTVRVARHFKGDAGRFAVVRTTMHSAACGYAFVEGESYLVYAHAFEGQLWTNICERTAGLEDARVDLRAFDALDLLEPRGGRCGGPSNFAMLQAMLFVLAGVALQRRRRK